MVTVHKELTAEVLFCFPIYTLIVFVTWEKTHKPTQISMGAIISRLVMGQQGW